ncbi:DsrE family protein [Desulfogranum japonicum]|uniref:DsrE family protein n=1 Tax=Desulfogranum japonicum TaxID=231447 RepID=UPI00040F7209|nr:DsrE family protein [Desulfogranum japonicum]
MPNKLNILWTNADPVTAELMVLMYAHNTLKRKLWEQVRVIIWGATAKLVAEDVHIQHLIKDAQKDGVVFSACVACAERLGVKGELKELSIEVKSWGAPLTELMQHDEKLITI